MTKRQTTMSDLWSKDGVKRRRVQAGGEGVPGTLDSGDAPAAAADSEAVPAKEAPIGKVAPASGGGDGKGPATTEQEPLFSVSWDAGQPVPYMLLARTFENIEALSGRLEMVGVLARVFKAIVQTTPDDLLPAIYLCTNRLAPAHEGLEIGVGEAILMRALSSATGRSMSVLKDAYQKAGDLGDVAVSFRSTQRTMFAAPPLTVRGVFDEFKLIARSSGKAAQEEKKKHIQKLLVSSRKGEAKYLARALQGKLRISVAERTVMAAMAECFPGDGGKEERLALLTQAYNQHPVWDTLVAVLLRKGAVDDELLEACKLVPGIPVSPMLAKPSKGIAEVVEKFSGTKFTCEYKYDGERAQIHRLPDGSIRIYSRNAENQTAKYPDVTQAMADVLASDRDEESFVLDAEIVAYDPATQKILPFQSLQGRARRDVKLEDIKVTVCIYAFDLLHLGHSIIRDDLATRRELLHTAFVEKPSVFQFAVGRDMDDPEEITAFLHDSIKAGCEGLMVKTLSGASATYEPANRTQNWLKVKKDYMEGMTDSLDLVPIAGYYGRGKRTGVFGAFLLASYNRDTEQYETVCKVGTGFSDEALAEFGRFYNEEDRIIGAQKPYYSFSGSSSLAPDVWFSASQVWEVRCADLSLSPAHTAARGSIDENRGVALRFPRFVRVRDDRDPESATSSEQVAEMYRAQLEVGSD